ncbi:MAG: hypothetical protein HY928_03505 [Elusimicrobia bacterium]|nr:hypothetical protein [Elusimicrobiota bacterium]
MNRPNRVCALILAGTLLLAPAPPVPAEGIKGSMTEEQLNDKWWEYYKNMGGVDPMEKWKEYVEESITPAELAELKDYKEKADAAMNAVDKISRGEFRIDGQKALKLAYERLRATKNLPRKLRRELPSAALIGKLLTTVELAATMMKANKGNEVALQAETLFQTLARDSSLSGPDDPLPADTHAALAVYNKYWLPRRSEQTRLESIARHQGYLSMKFREQDNLGAPTTRSYVDGTPFNGTVGMEDLSTYDANVVDALVSVLKMAADYKKGDIQQRQAQTEARELMSGFERWGHITGEDFDALQSLLDIEKKVEAAVPSYAKMLAAVPVELAEARASLKDDMGMASKFCGTTAPALYSAKLGLRDFGARSTKVVQKVQGMLPAVTAAEQDARKFCDEFSRLSELKEAERLKEKDKEYAQYVKDIRNACSAGGFSGMRYDGPRQAEIDALVGKVDAAIARDGQNDVTVGKFLDLHYLDQVPSYDETADESSRAQILSRLRGDISAPPDDSLAGLYLKAIGLFEAHLKARAALVKTANAAAQAIGAESARQQSRCEAMRELARQQKKPEPDCVWCDAGPAAEAAGIAISRIPALKFSGLEAPVRRWRAAQDAAAKISRAAQTSFFEDISNAIKALDSVFVAGESFTSSADTIRGFYTRVLQETQASGYFHAFNELRNAGMRLRSQHDEMERELALAQKSSAKTTAAILKAAQDAEQELSRLRSESNTAARNFQIATDFFSQSPWPEQAAWYREKAKEIPESLAQLQELITKTKKSAPGYEKGLQEAAAALKDLDWHAASFSASAAKLKKLGDEIEADWHLRELQSRAAGGERAGNQYLQGLDAPMKAALTDKLSKARSGMGEVELKVAGFAAREVEKMLAVLSRLKVVPADAILLDGGKTESLLQAKVYRDLGAKARKLNPELMASQGEAARIRGEVEGVYTFDDFYRKEYASHPVLKAYQDALAACDEVEKKGEASRAKLASSMKMEVDAISKEMDPLFKKPGDATSAKLASLETRIRAVVGQYRLGFSGKDREGLGFDPQELEPRLGELRTAAEEAGRDKAAESARKALSALIPRMAAATPSQAGAILQEAQKLASDGRIGGEPETQDIMGKLAELARQKGASGPPSADGPGDEVGKDFFNDLGALQRDLIALPGGPGSQDRADDLVERANMLLEKAQDKLPAGPSGRPNPNLLPMRDALAVFQKSAEARKVQAGPSSPGADAAAMEPVRKLYERFSAAFAAKDLAAVLDCLTEDWEASEGTTLSDMESTLSNSFQAFDSVRMEIQNLQIRPAGNGRFTTSYSTHMVGTIRQNDIRHEEKSTHQDTVVFTNGSPRIQRTTGGTGWVQ